LLALRSASDSPQRNCLRHRVKKQVKTKVECVVLTFCTCFAQILTPRTKRIFLLGWSDPRLTLATEPCAKVGLSSLTRRHSAAILPILSCATSSCLAICSLARVNARVTDKVICAFHAPVTFSRCRKRWRPFDIAEASTIKEASKREKVRKNFAP
jgi:hypothetical protein